MNAGSQIPIAALPDRELREEWEHFRGFRWSDERIAERLGVKWNTVQVWVLRFEATGSTARPSHLRRRERVAELVADGLEPKAIAAELGVSLHTVHDDCCRMGLTRGRTVRALRSA